MKLRALGRTGLMVSRMGLGLAALGRPGYINLNHDTDLNRDYEEAVMERLAHQVFDTARNAGVCYFDAARSYGLAEKFLASWLSSRSIRPDQLTVGSKWGYTYTAGWRVQAEFHEVKDHSLAVLRRQWRESLALLKGHLCLYQIHSATLESGVLQNSDVLNELAKLKHEGVHIGITLSGPAQAETLRRAMEIQLEGTQLFETVQATWNLLEPSAGPALSEASAAGMGVIIKEALANGRLTERNHETGFESKLAILRNEASRLKTSLDALALAACLAQPFTDVVLSGATTVSQAVSNFGACSLKLGDAENRLAELAEPVETYWATRKRLRWN